MYDKSDPRSALAGQRRPATSAMNDPADFARFYACDAQQSDAQSRTWIVRGQNALVCYTVGDSGTVLSRNEQPDEYALIIPDATRVVIDTPVETLRLDGYHVAFVPPGRSAVSLPDGGKVARIFTTRAADLCDLAANAAAHANRRQTVASITDWPEPGDADRIYAYSTNVPRQEGRFGRIWRGRTVMLNCLDPHDGPRDPSRLSPHSHDDFEQFSLVLEGEYEHHIRWPWLTDKALWRDDAHEACAAPSVAIIPPPAIHTSQAVSSGLNRMVDIFCPPRRDFSDKAGWVLNADDYPAA